MTVGSTKRPTKPLKEIIVNSRCSIMILDNDFVRDDNQIL